MSEHQEAITQFANFIGNSERKTLLGSIALADPTANHDAVSLRAAYHDHQPNEVAWMLRLKDCAEFIDRALVPGGVVEPVEATNDPCKYQTISDNVDVLSSATGALLRWGLEYEDVSVQQILGASQAQSTVRSPGARLCIYGELLSNQRIQMRKLEDLSTTIGYKTPDCVPRLVEKLEDLGIVDIELPDEQNPMIQISPSEYERSYAGDKVELIREFAATFPEGTILTIDDFLGRFRHRLSEVGLVELRRWLLKCFNSSSNFQYANLKRLDTTSTKTSYVKLNDDMRGPIEDLYTSLTEISQAGPKKKFSRTMHDVLEQPGGEWFTALLDKGRSFSGRAHKDDSSVMYQKILSLMPKGRATMTVREIREKLQESYDKNLTVAGLRRIMNAMASNGLLERDQAEVGSRIIDSKFVTHDPRITNVYRLPAEATKTEKRSKQGKARSKN